MFIYNTFHFQSEQFGGGAEAIEVGGETEANSLEVGLRRILNTSDITWDDNFQTQFYHTQSINTQLFEEEDLNGDCTQSFNSQELFLILVGEIRVR